MQHRYRYVIDILNAVAATRSRKEKIAILRANRDFRDLKEVIRCALDPLITYGIKTIPPYKNTHGGQCWSLHAALEKINNRFASKKVTGNAAINELAVILESVDEKDAQAIERVIRKNLDCGVQIKTATEVWENLVNEFPLMKCGKLDDTTQKLIVYPAYAQEKLDGARCNFLIDRNGSLTVFSGNGKELTTHGVFDKWIAKNLYNSVLDGEILVSDSNGNLLSRKEGNGIINKAIRGTITPEEADQMYFVVWDAIPIANWQANKPTNGLTYEKRFSWLQFVLKSNKKIKLVQSIQVESFEHARRFYDKLRAEGKEGIIIKNAQSQWEPKRSNQHLKMKPVNYADLEIIEVIEGRGKYQGMVGAFLCQTSDGLLRVSVGSGLTDKDREDFFTEKMVGTIIEVKYFEVISDEYGNKSLFLPIFSHVREDKTVANTLIELK